MFYFFDFSRCSSVITVWWHMAASSHTAGEEKVVQCVQRAGHSDGHYGFVEGDMITWYDDGC